MKKPSKYVMIYDELKRKIMEGGFPDGKLPPFSRLTLEFGVSLLTVNRAVKQLEADGIVCCSTGRGGTRLNLPGLQQLNRGGEQHLNSYGDAFLFRKRQITLRCLSSAEGALPPEVFTDIVTQFQQEFPWIKLECDFVDYLENVDCSSHDLFIAGSSEFRSLEADGRLLSLAAFPEVAPGIVPELEGASSRLLTLNMPLLYFNRAEVPSPPESWSEYERITAGLRNSSHYAANLLGLVSLLHCFTGNLHDAVGGREFLSGVAGALRILQLHYRWNAGWNNCNPDDILNAFHARKISLLFGYMFGRSEFPPDADISVAPPPGREKTIPMEGIRCGINAGCPKYKDAWLFLNYMRSTPVQNRLAAAGAGVPAGREAFHGAFRADQARLYDCVCTMLPRLEESCLSEEMRVNIYMRLYPVLEECFRKGEPTEEFIGSFAAKLAELVCLDEVRKESRS